MNNFPVVAIRANDISFLGLLRGISSVPNIDLIPIVFKWNEKKWYSESSRYYKNYIIIPNPATEKKQAISALIKIGKSILQKYNQKALVFCSSDVNLVFFHMYEHLLSEYFIISGDKNLNSYKSDLSNKGIFFSKLKKKFPELTLDFIHVKRSDNLDKISNWQKFPCVINPAIKDLSQSFYSLHKGDKAIFCKDSNSLKKITKNLIALDYELIIQEYLKFKLIKDEIPTYAYFDKNYEIKVYANGIKKIIYPNKFGTAIALESSFSEELIKLTERVGKYLEWNGPLMIEFVKDNRNNNFKILEINTRPWLFHDFYRQIGLPFIPITIREYFDKLSINNEIIIPKKNNIGITNFDLNSMIELFQSLNKNIVLSKSKKTKSFIDFLLNNSQLEKKYAHFDENDPVPLIDLIRSISAKYNLDYNDLSNFIKIS